MADQPDSTPLDKEKFKQEVKAEAVKEAQDALIERLSGDKKKYSWEEQGKKAPGDYDELFDEVDKRTVKPDQVTDIVKQELEADRKAQADAELKKLETERETQAKDFEKKKENFDQEWYKLVSEKKMPAPSTEIQDKINKGEKLTKEDIDGDEGLKARLELAKHSQNKDPRLAYYEDYNQESPGADAPILGRKANVPRTESNELTREEVIENRKKLFGY